jgi:hypothetical protein
MFNGLEGTFERIASVLIEYFVFFIIYAIDFIMSVAPMGVGFFFSLELV